MVPELKGTITFEPQYSQPEAVKGLSGFSHIWILWDFSLEHDKNHNLTVRPPRLGGKESVGVFASRSPFRPNSIGLSSVRLDSTSDGSRRYGFYFASYDVRFRVTGRELTVVEMVLQK